MHVRTLGVYTAIFLPSFNSSAHLLSRMSDVVGACAQLIKRFILHNLQVSE